MLTGALAERKRAVAAAEFEGDRYLAHAPQVVASEAPLVERMGVGSTALS